MSAGLTLGIGNIGFFGQGLEAVLGKALLHGVAQGALAEARGVEFGAAFLAASFAHAAGSLAAEIDVLKGTSVDKVAARTAAAAVVGGTASVIGGGKFQNGAATAAFVHLFNAESIYTRLGRDAHEAFADFVVGQNLESEIRFKKEDFQIESIRSYVRLDAYDPSARAFWELKPDTITGHISGRLQIEFYRNLLNLTPGGNLGTLVVGTSSSAVRSPLGNYFIFENRGRGLITYQQMTHERSWMERVGPVFRGASPGFGLRPGIPRWRGAN